MFVSSRRGSRRRAGRVDAGLQVGEVSQQGFQAGAGGGCGGGFTAERQQIDLYGLFALFAAREGET